MTQSTTRAANGEKTKPPRRAAPDLDAVGAEEAGAAPEGLVRRIRQKELRSELQESERRLGVLAAKHRGLKRLSWAQPHDGLGLDLDRLASLRVAAHARLAMRLHRSPEIGDDELARATLQLLHRQLEQFVEERRCGLLRRAQLAGDICHDLGLAHWLCHQLESPPQKWVLRFLRNPESPGPEIGIRRRRRRHYSRTVRGKASANLKNARKNAPSVGPRLQNPLLKRLRSEQANSLKFFKRRPAAWPGPHRNGRWT